jgi:hypothetical protein
MDPMETNFKGYRCAETVEGTDEENENIQSACD